MNLKAREEEQRAHAELLEHFDAFILGCEGEYGGANNHAENQQEGHRRQAVAQHIRDQRRE